MMTVESLNDWLNEVMTDGVDPETPITLEDLPGPCLVIRRTPIRYIYELDQGETDQ